MANIVTEEVVGEISVDIHSKYKDSRKREIAVGALADCQRFVNTLPANTYSKKDVKAMLNVHKRCYLGKVMQEQKLQPKGFLTLTFIAAAVISAIIGWVVRRILDRLVLSEDGKVYSSK